MLPRRRGRRRARTASPPLPVPAAAPTRRHPTGGAGSARRPVTGRGAAPQEVSSGSWVKVLGQQRAPCAGSDRRLRQALVSLSRFSNPPLPSAGSGGRSAQGGVGCGTRRLAAGSPAAPARGPAALPPSLLGTPVPPRRCRLARLRERDGGRAVGARGRSGAGTAAPAAAGGPRERGQRARPRVAIARGAVASGGAERGAPSPGQ